MINDRQINLKNLQLIISVIIIIPVALVYGLFPSVVLPELFVIKIDNVNLSNICRAIMGMYLAMSFLWIVGITKPRFWFTATISNTLFMGGLATGRLLSLLLDGPPSNYFVVGLLIEILLAAWGVINLKKHPHNFQS